MNIVCPFTQEVEHLRKGQGHNEVISRGGIGNNEEYRRFPISDAVKLQFVIGHDFTKLRDVKGRQPSTAGNQNAFAVLPETKSQGLFHQIHKEVTFCGLPHEAYA